jgi:hypothetical protein
MPGRLVPGGQKAIKDNKLRDQSISQLARDQRSMMAVFLALMMYHCPVLFFSAFHCKSYEGHCWQSETCCEVYPGAVRQPELPRGTSSMPAAAKQCKQRRAAGASWWCSKCSAKQREHLWLHKVFRSLLNHWISVHLLNRSEKSVYTLSLVSKG